MRNLEEWVNLDKVHPLFQDFGFFSASGTVFGTFDNVADVGGFGRPM